MPQKAVITLSETAEKTLCIETKFKPRLDLNCDKNNSKIVCFAYGVIMKALRDEAKK